jgi:hypothetical protein
MAFTVKQLTDEPIILITYRRPDSTIDEASTEGKKIAYLLREIGDFAYVILDLSGHKSSYHILYNTIQDVLKKNSGKMDNPSHNVVMVGSSSLVTFHQAQVKTDKASGYCWIVTNNLEHAFEMVRAKLNNGDMP